MASMKWSPAASTISTGSPLASCCAVLKASERDVPPAVTCKLWRGGGGAGGGEGGGGEGGGGEGGGNEGGNEGG
eukprot:744750-Prymnesium_polylepis.1